MKTRVGMRCAQPWKRAEMVKTSPTDLTNTLLRKARPPRFLRQSTQRGATNMRSDHALFCTLPLLCPRRVVANGGCDRTPSDCSCCAVSDLKAWFLDDTKCGSPYWWCTWCQAVVANQAVSVTASTAVGVDLLGCGSAFLWCSCLSLWRSASRRLAAAGMPRHTKSAPDAQRVGEAAAGGHFVTFIRP